MKKTNSFIWLVGILLVILLGIIISNISQNNSRSYLKQIKADKYYDLLKEKDQSYIYIGKNNCSECDKLDTALSQFVTNAEIDINYLNTDAMDDEEYSDFIKSNDLFKDKLTLPMLLIVKDNKIIASRSGSTDYDTVGNFLMQVSNSTEKFTSITVDDYLNLFNGSTKSYIYIGKTSCGYCQQINPILTRIVNEKGIKINYLNLETIASEADYNKLTSSNEVLSGDWGTPTLLIVQDKKVVNSHIGFAAYDVINNFILEK